MKGERGQPGDDKVSSKGLKGDQGDKGLPGELSLTGSPGIIAGQYGAKGDPGMKGDYGPAGPDGPIGPQVKDIFFLHSVVLYFDFLSFLIYRDTLVLSAIKVIRATMVWMGPVANKVNLATPVLLA